MAAQRGEPPNLSRKQSMVGRSGCHLIVTLVACGLLAGGAVRADQPGTTPTTFWIYKNGKFAWPGDYSYQATVDYKDKAGKPDGETYDIAVTLNGQWGAWQPYASGMNYDRTGRTNLVFKLKPTKGTGFSLQFLKVGDKPMRVSPTNGGQLSVDISKYGPAPTPGQWGSYSVPLDDVVKDAGVVLQNFYKFAIQNQSGLGDDVYYIADVGIE
jgi:hypothetical protein